jgi:hypothetical protein
MEPLELTIEELNPADLPSREHLVPAMKDGTTVKLTIGQILDLLVDAAPGALDTLNELAAALGDDPNFAATTAALIATKANFSDVAAALALKADLVQPFVDVVSAATTDIGSAASQNVRITGTTTIISLGTAPAGTFRRVRVAGALTLTHNGTSLILPGAVSITTAANESFDAVSLGSGNWFVTNYQQGSVISTGSFTPDLAYGGVSSGATGAKTGTYTKIGKMVFFTLRLTLTGAGSGTGVVTITGLPFAANARDFSVSVGFAAGFNTLSGALAAFVQAGTSTLSLRQSSGFGYVSGVTQANITNATDIIMSGTYEVA